MRAFWDDCGDGLTSDQAKEVDLREAGLIWSDEVRGVQGNFLGLIDDQERTVQLILASGIPNDVDDASHLRIVLMDFPQLERRGSYGKRVTTGKVRQMIETAFKDGADHHHFGEVTFTTW